MGWKQTTISFLGDALRFTVRACLLFDGLLFAVFSVWWIAKFFWHLHGYLNRVMFSSEW